MADSPANDSPTKRVLEYRTQQDRRLSAKDRLVCVGLAALCWGICAFPVIGSIYSFIKGEYVLSVLCCVPMALTGYWAVYFTLRSLNAAQPRMEKEIVEDGRE